jgi:hypothetical protein
MGLYESRFASVVYDAVRLANGLVRQYREKRRLNLVALRSLSMQVDQAVKIAPLAQIDPWIREKTENLKTAVGLVVESRIDDPVLRSAMDQLADLTYNLSAYIYVFADPADIPSLADVAAAAELVPIWIYVEETKAGPRVERTLAALLSEVGIGGLAGPAPMVGSWFRRLFGIVKAASDTHTAQELRRAAEIQLIDRFQAGIDGATAGAVSHMIGALANTRGAVIQAGSVLLVKVDDKIIVRQLTPEQLLHWNVNPGLFLDPAAALIELQRAMETDSGYGARFHVS